MYLQYVTVYNWKWGYKPQVYRGGARVLEQYKGAKQYSHGEVYCNCCGELIANRERTVGHIDYLHVEKAWGYFSSKDLTGHSFNICEQCYDKWLQSFCIPVQEFSVDEIPGYSEDEIAQLNAAYEAEAYKG